MSQSDPILEFRGVVKQYGSAAAPTLRGIDLTLRRGEFFSLIGPSGCGKTTTLKLVSGLEYPTDGSILLEGEDISRIPTHRRPVHTVFQSYALFPHMTVRENIAFGLKQAKISRAEMNRKVEDAIEMVGLGANSGKKPDELSGGMQQRVALARSLVLSPKILLLDEPLGALDLQLRQQMQMQLKRIQRETGVTFLYVTHDQEEAFSMSDRIGFMHAGSLVQVDAPAQMYHQPRNGLVADFVGTANQFAVVSEGGGRLATDHFEIDAARAASGPRASTDPAGSSVVVLRPEHLRVELPGDASSCEVSFSGRIVDLSFKGASTAVLARVGEQEVVASVWDPRRSAALDVGDEVEIGFDHHAAWVCEGAVSAP